MIFYSCFPMDMTQVTSNSMSVPLRSQNSFSDCLLFYFPGAFNKVGYCHLLRYSLLSFLNTYCLLYFCTFSSLFFVHLFCFANKILQYEEMQQEILIGPFPCLTLHIWKWLPLYFDTYYWYVRYCHSYTDIL